MLKEKISCLPMNIFYYIFYCYWKKLFSFQDYIKLKKDEVEVDVLMKPEKEFFSPKKRVKTKKKNNEKR